ncbi:MAG: S8 family serine peptidase [Planctomycetia bacterium]|nr:MAG: S8 family serine peptidase [Planctomycetia bacterium]
MSALYPRRMLAAACLVAALVPIARADGDCEDQSAIVQLAPGASVVGFHAQYGTSSLDEIPGRGIHLVSVPEGTNYGDLAQAVAGDPQVQGIEQNCLVSDESPEGGTRSFFFNVAPGTFEAQPAASLAQLDTAGAYSRGRGVVVAVLDTGVAPHPLIASQIAPGGFNLVGKNSDTSDVGDGLDNDGDGLIDEMVGHGTFIAGLVLRAAPQARILPVRVMNDEGISSTFLLTAGIYHAANAGASILNISMGTTQPSALLENAVEFAAGRGCVVVASVGNEGNATPIRYPAGYVQHGVLAVAATTDEDRRADFSNYGPHVSLCAPGVDVASADTVSAWVAASGTSYSAPLVAGTAALLRRIAPHAGPALIRSALLDACDPIDALNPGYEGQLGRGRLNAVRAVRDPRLTQALSWDRRSALRPGSPPPARPAGLSPAGTQRLAR